MILSEELRRRSICHIETVGRWTGLPREIEIWFAAEPDRDRIYVLAGGRERAHWVRNLLAEPRVRVRFGGAQFDGAGRPIEGEPDELRARTLVASKYQGWTEGRGLSVWARESLPVAIDLHSAIQSTP